MVKLVEDKRVLKGECLPSLDNSGEAAVLAGGYDFAGFELDWGAAVAAPNFLGYSIHGLLPQMFTFENFSCYNNA